MIKSTILSYLNEIKIAIEEGRFISAYKSLNFLIKQVRYSL